MLKKIKNTLVFKEKKISLLLQLFQEVLQVNQEPKEK